MIQSGTPLPKMVDLILGNIADGVFTVDPEFRITFFNRAAEKITGLSSEDAVGRPCAEVFRTRLCGSDCPLRRSLSSAVTVKNFEIEINTQEGKQQIVSVSTAPLLGNQGEFLGGVETFRDLTPLNELRRQVRASYTLQDIIGKSQPMRQMLINLPNIASSDATVLLQGRSGTGKELVARALHNMSPRKDGPLVAVSCGSLPEMLWESELFGTRPQDGTPGRHLVGRVEAAHGGTLFLDEVADIPVTLQGRLVRVLESRAAGGDMGQQSSDVRVIAATRTDLKQMVRAGQFREDLYYRLNVISLSLPDLSQRREDIPLLAAHFIERLALQTGREARPLSDETLACLLRYGFPGNVRELENALEHAHIVAQGARIEPHDLPSHVLEAEREVSSSGGATTEARELREALERNGWSTPRTARELGVHRTTLWRRIKRFGLERG